MVLGVLHLALRLPEAHSLKEKRCILKSLVTRVKNRFNVSIAEVDAQDKWQLSTVVAAHVGNSRPHANQLLDHVLQFAESVKQIEVVDSKLEFF